MKGRKPLTIAFLFLTLLSTCLSASLAYENHVVLSDGNVILYGGIQLKPNSIHTYIPQMDARYKNVTLDSGTLRLSKDSDAYEILCSTDDNITVSLLQWFYGSYYTTEFTPLSETETSLTFNVTTRERGEPSQVRGVSTWTFNNETTVLSLTCVNASLVSFFFRSEQATQFEWYMVRIPMWMGLAGLGMMIVTPLLTVIMLKSKEYEYASIIALIGLAVGFSMFIAWLWG